VTGPTSGASTPATDYLNGSKKIMTSLKNKVVIAFASRFVLVGALLFVPANSLAFPRAWAFLAVYFLPQAWMISYFLRTDPKFIERRLKIGPRAETRTRQKLVMVLLMLSSFVSVMIAGFDHRFGLSHVPAAASIAAYFVMLIGIAIQFYVFVENSFASATIELAPDQRVIATGPYAFVRHPMYSGMLLMDCFIPLALGCWWAFLPTLAKVPVVVLRLLDEEEFLRANLPGYADYCEKVPHRLVPGVW
jgi:protein-S-isoprenylcysteine O-methyltransferase Ste14